MTKTAPIKTKAEASTAADFVADAWSAIDGWADLNTALAAADNVVLPTTAAVDDIESKTRDDLRAGKLDVDKLLAALADATAKRAAAVEARRIVERARVGLRREREALQHEHADIALAHLGPELEAILGQLAEIAPALDSVDSAEAAILAGADASAAWAQLVALATRHDKLRKAQLLITQHAAPYGLDAADRQRAERDVRRFGVFRDAGRFAPLAAELRTGRADYEQRSPWWRGGVDTLLFALRPGAELWLPTATELAETSAAWDERLREVRRAIDAGLDPMALSEQQRQALDNGRQRPARRGQHPAFPTELAGTVR